MSSFCATLGYSPTMLAHKNSPDNVTYELAQLIKVQTGKASKKATFVIIDRGMDIRAVLMHDLCLQVRTSFTRHSTLAHSFSHSHTPYEQH